MAPCDLPLTEIGFELRGRLGRVLVRYGVNEDPGRWGYPLLGLDSLVETSRGFPIIQADVEYDAEGYAAILAWIQVVRVQDLDSGESTALVDGPPQFTGLDLPYATFGICPTLFDAPSTDQSAHSDWEARAILVASPDGLMTRRVRPLCGFSWGYRLRDSTPDPLPLHELDGSTWREDRDLLGKQHPSWSFE